MHARIADDHDLVDPLGEDARIARDLLDVLVQEADDARLELSEVSRVGLREGDPRHEVAPEDRLRVEARDGGHLLAGGQLHQRRHHARGADVDGEAVLVERGVARLDGEDAATEARDGDLALAVAEGGGQGLPDVGGHVVDGGAGGGQQLLEVRGLVMLVLGQRDLHDLLVDPGVEGHGGRRAGQPLAAEDLKAALVDGRGDLDGRRRDHRALAGEAIAVADQPLAELELIRDRGRRCSARDELDPARRAPTAPAAGRRDVDAGGVRRLQDGRSGL